MQQGTIFALAVVMVVFATPLFLDLGLSIVGNLLRARGPHAAQRRTIRLAVVVPAHDEETMIARTVRSLKAADGCDADLCGGAQLLRSNGGDGGEGRSRGCGAEESQTARQGSGAAAWICGGSGGGGQRGSGDRCRFRGEPEFVGGDAREAGRGRGGYTVPL